MNFWKWFFKGDVSGMNPDEKMDHPFGIKSPGVSAYFDKWLLLHLASGITLAYAISLDFSVAANTVLVPLAGIFIGLSFSWGGNAMSLMQTDEIEKLADHRPGGLRQYVFKYQSAILIILVTMILWGLAGLRLFDFTHSVGLLRWLHVLIEIGLYALTSCAIRECWHVVLGAQNMLLLRRAIRKLKEK